MKRSAPHPRADRLRRTLCHSLAVLAWLAVVAQVVGLPIHLAAEEHYHADHGADHVHYGAFGHGEHHAAHHAKRATHDHDAGHDHDAPHDPAPAAPTGCDDESRLPPHSALDHLIDSHLRRDHEASVPTPSATWLAALESPPLLAPRLERRLPIEPRAPPPRPPPPRRPDQARAPPTRLV